MNTSLMEQARAAYRAGDYTTAASMFGAVKSAGEVAGEVDHLRGNALMHLGMYANAAEAYGAALEDASYGKKGALLTNQGKAFLAAGNYSEAVQSFSAATQDTTYPTPYKAFMGLGNALSATGQVAEAGTAYRQAAIDGTNPAPAGALAQLADCFVKMGRPQDAVESYRTALDFAGPRDDTRSINAGMAQALSAAGRPQDALDAYQRATSDGIYQLTAEQAEDRARIQDQLDAASAQRAISQTAPADLSATDPSMGYDPLDPMGQSGQFMPDPSDTGFFSLTEAEMVQQDRAQAKVRRKKRHTGLKVFIVILIILLIALGGLGFCYTQGMGYPSQETVLNNLFTAVSDGNADNAAACLDSSLSDEEKALIVSTIPSNATPTIEGMDKSMTECTAKVSVSLSKGGTQDYEVKFTRSSNFIGWSVASIDLDFGTSN